MIIKVRMETNNIYWKDAIELIKNGKEVFQSEIDYRNEQIPVKEVAFLNRHKLRVPEDLVFMMMIKLIAAIFRNLPKKT